MRRRGGRVGVGWAGVAGLRGAGIGGGVWDPGGEGRTRRLLLLLQRLKLGVMGLKLWLKLWLRRWVGVWLLLLLGGGPVQPGEGVDWAGRRGNGLV